MFFFLRLGNRYEIVKHNIKIKNGELLFIRLFSLSSNRLSNRLISTNQIYCR